MAKKAFIPFRIESSGYDSGNWTIHIDPDSLSVCAVKKTPCHSSATVREFVAKTLKQAWFAYFNPFEIDALLKPYKA